MGKSLVLKCTSGDPDFPDKYQRDLGFNSTLLDLAVHDIGKCMEEEEKD
jgi:hypothetical protein